MLNRARHSRLPSFFLAALLAAAAATVVATGQQVYANPGTCIDYVCSSDSDCLRHDLCNLCLDNGKAKRCAQT